MCWKIAEGWITEEIKTCSVHLSKRKQRLQDAVYKNLHGGKVTDANHSLNGAGNSQNEQQDAVINNIFKYCCTKYISWSFLDAHLCSKRLDLSMEVTGEVLQPTTFKVIQSHWSKGLYWENMPNILSIYRWNRTYFTTVQCKYQLFSNPLDINS